MKALALFFLLALLGSTTCNNNKYNPDFTDFGVSIPSGFLQGFLSRIFIPLLQDYLRLIGERLPEQCCYKKGVQKVQLTNITGIGTNGDSTVQSSANGMQIYADVGIHVGLHFKLCTQAAGRCTTSFFCNDNIDLELEVKLSLLLQANASSSGELLLSSPDNSLEIAIPSYGKLCLVVKELIEPLISDVNKDLEVVFSAVVNDLLKVLGKALTLSLDIENVLNFSVLYASQDTGTSNTGLALGGWTNITSLVTGKPTTALPSSALPNPLLTTQPSNEEELYVSDSIPNNVLQTIFDVLPSHFTLDLYLQGNLFKLRFHLRHTPEVLFSSSQGSSILVKTREVVQNGLIRINFDVNTQIFFNFKHDGNRVYLSLNPDNFVFDAEILPPFDPNIKNITGLVDQLVENQWAKYIPLLDKELARFSIPLPPLPQFFDFPGKQDSNGFTRVFIENNPKPAAISEDSFYELTALYPKTTAMLKEGMNGATSKFFQLFSKYLAQELPKTNTQMFTQGEPSRRGVKKDTPHFACPPLPDFAYDTCP